MLSCKTYKRAGANGKGAARFDVLRRDELLPVLVNPNEAIGWYLPAIQRKN